MNEPQLQLRPQSSQRHLEDILNDPNANWSDIRCAIKARGKSACTNIAVMRALSRRMSSMSSSGSASNHDDVSFAAQSSVEKNSVNASCEDSGDQYEEYCVPVFQDAALSSDAQCSNLHRRRSIHKSYMRRSSLLSRSSFVSTTPSINIMDFGVDNYVDLHQSNIDIVSFNNRRDSCISNYSCDSDGFMGWKQDITQSSTFRRSSVFSSEDDGQMGAGNLGTLGENEVVCAPVDEKIADEAGKTDEENEKGGQTLRRSWHIEDYDEQPLGDSKNPRDILSLLNRAASVSKLETGVPFWKRYAPVKNTREHCSAPQAETVELEDVKRALMNVRKNSCITGDIIDTDAPVRPKHREVNKARFSLSTMGDSIRMLNEICPSETEPSATCKQVRSRSTIDAAPSATSRANNSRRHRPSCVVKFSEIAFDDTREAIWINKSDGGVDIVNEARKLYYD